VIWCSHICLPNSVFLHSTSWQVIVPLLVFRTYCKKAYNSLFQTLHIVIIPQNVKQEGFNAESGHQVLNIRKNPREENTSSEEQDLHLKRQRTTGAFSHAGLVRMRYCSFLWNTLHCMYHGALFFLCNGRSRITSSLSMLWSVKSSVVPNHFTIYMLPNTNLVSWCVFSAGQ